MDNNEYAVKLTAGLQQAKSQRQINADIRQLEKVLRMLRFTGTLAKGDTKHEINQYIKDLGAKLSSVKLKGKLDAKNLKREIDESLHQLTFDDIDALKIDENKAILKLKKVLADVKAFTEKNVVTVSIGIKKEKLGSDLAAFLDQNSKIKESSVFMEESERIQALILSANDQKSLKTASDALKLFQSEARATGFATENMGSRMKNLLSQIKKIGDFFGISSMAVNSFRKSLETMKGNDTILLEISRACEMTKRQLEELGNEAFQTAGRYGRSSSDYLQSVRQMAESGYGTQSREMGELSLLAQSAGMTAETANNYLLAADAAYRYGGSVEKLTAALDGAN